MNSPLVTIGRRGFILGTAVLATGCLRSEPAGRLRLAAGDPGGLYLAFAEILAGRIRARYPGIAVQVLTTEGSLANLDLLGSGQADLGLVLADVAERDRATGPGGTAPAAVARVYENYLQVIVRESTGVQTISDLKGKRVSIGPSGSGAAATSQVLLQAADLRGRVDLVGYHLRDALARIADGGIDALVWSGGVPTPAISELDAQLPLRILDIGTLASPMSLISGYPYVLRRVPTCDYVPAGIHSIGVPDLLLCRQDTDAGLVRAVVDTLATDAPQLVPHYVRGLQYLDAPSMIQTGLIPLHPGAVDAYRTLHG